MKFATFFRTPTFKNICEWLLLYLHVILFAIHEKDTANTMRGWNPLKQTWWFFFLENSCDLLFPQKRSIIDIWHDSKCRGGPPKVLYNKQWSYKFWKIRRKKPVIESLKEETLAQVFSCEFWEICKNTFFIENRRWLLLSIRLWTTEIAFTITIQMTIQHFLVQRSKYRTK